MVSKIDKGQGIVVVDKKGFYDSLDQLFNDTSKIEILSENPTLCNLSSFNNSKILEYIKIEG